MLMGPHMPGNTPLTPSTTPVSLPAHTVCVRTRTLAPRPLASGRAALWLLLLATSPDPWAPARLLRLLRPGLPAAPPGGQAPPLTYSGYGTAVRVCFYVYLSLQVRGMAATGKRVWPNETLDSPRSLSWLCYWKWWAPHPYLLDPFLLVYHNTVCVVHTHMLPLSMNGYPPSPHFFMLLLWLSLLLALHVCLYVCAACLPFESATPYCRSPISCVCFPLRARLWRGLHC